MTIGKIFFSTDLPLGVGLLFILTGSFTYIGSPSFAVGTFIVFLLGPFYFLKWIERNKINLIDLIMVVVLLVLVALMMVGYLFYRTENNTRYIKAFLFNLLSFPIILIISEKHSNAVKFGVFAFIAVIVIVAILQLGYVYYGIGLDPVMATAEDWTSGNTFKNSGIRSIFMNPNDFSVICSLLLVYILNGVGLRNRVRNIIVVSLIMMIIVSASRSCVIMGLIMVSIFYGRRRFGILFILMVIVAALIIMYWVTESQGLNFGESYWAQKIQSIFSMLVGIYHDNINSVSDDSILTRISGFIQFIQNFNKIGIGLFTANDYYAVLHRGDVLDRSPHSLLVELSFLFGFAGFIACLGLFYWIWSSIRSGGVSRFVAACIFLSLFLLSFVSSSVINFPPFWVILYLIGIGIRTADSNLRRNTQGINERGWNARVS